MSILVTSSKDYFESAIRDSLDQQGIRTPPYVTTYLAGLLEFFVDSRNLYDDEPNESGNRKPTTLAEMLLVAHNSDYPVKVDLLKRLGDRALYISGFFGDSLSRSLVDLDYYRDMGVTAYSTLSGSVKENTLSKLYFEISDKFVPLSDSLTLISQKSSITSDVGILRLYERYLRTGSELAKTRLIELGVLTNNEAKKSTKQS